MSDRSERLEDPSGVRSELLAAAGEGALDSDADLSGDSLSVLVLPDNTSSNPYQGLLLSELSRLGVDVDVCDPNKWLPITVAFARKGVPDVLHLHWIHRFFVTSNPLLTAVLGIRLTIELFIARLLGVDVVWTVHNLMDHERRSPTVEVVFRHVVARLCGRLVVHCDAAKERVVEAYRLPPSVAERIDVVPHGHYIHSYPSWMSRKRARSKLGYGSDETVFLYFGMIRPYKNVPELVETFQRLSAADVRLLVVGNPWNEEMHEAVETACADDDRVTCVLKFVPDEEIQRYMNAADAAVLPFSEVLTSGSALLTMSFGQALVAPRDGCVSELLEDGGGVGYDPDDESGLFEALQRAAEADLEEMGERNRELVATFDWGDIARETRRVYLRAAGRRPRAVVRDRVDPLRGRR